MRRLAGLPIVRLLGDGLLQVTAILVLALALTALGALLYDVMSNGWDRLNWQFLTSFPSRRASEAGIYPALIGTLYVISLTAALALPVGIAAATPTGSASAAVSPITQMVPISA